MRLLTSILLAATVSACGGGGDEPAEEPMQPACVAAKAERESVPAGDGAHLIVMAVDVPAASVARSVVVSFDANRAIETKSGVDRVNAIGAYHFLRVYTDGEFLMTLPFTLGDEAVTPIPASTCIAARQSEATRISIPAGVAVRVEAVWSIIRPREGEDVTAITERAAFHVK